MSSIVVSGDTSGAITIAAPAVSGTNTLTLPALTGTILTTSTPGAVLQVVQITYATQVTTGSSSYVDTGLSGSITPKFSTSKILVILHQNGTGKDATNTSFNIKLLRNGSDAATYISGNFTSFNNAAQFNLVGTSSFTYLDSPATTSPITYKTQFNTPSGGTVYAQGNGQTSTMTLIEVAA